MFSKIITALLSIFLVLLGATAGPLPEPGHHHGHGGYGHGGHGHGGYGHRSYGHQSHGYGGYGHG